MAVRRSVTGMTIGLAVLLLGAWMVLAPQPGLAHGSKHKGLDISHPWVAPTPDVKVPAIVRFDIKNTGKQADRLVSASTPAATRVEIVDAAGGASAAKSAAVPTFEVGPGQSVSLSVEGVHLRLIGLKKPLSAFDTFELTLNFAKAGKVAVEVLVDE